MAGKLRRILDGIIDARLAPFVNVVGPEQITVTGEATGTINSNKPGRVTMVDLIPGQLNLQVGMIVIGVPLGGRKYSVVGII